MRKKIIILLLVILGAFFSSDAFSQPRSGGRMGHGLEPVTPPPDPGFGHLGGMCFGDDNYMRGTLNFSNTQIESISKINKDFGNKLYLLRKKLRPLNQSLIDHLLSSNIDLKKVREILTEISGIEIEIRMTKIEHRMAIENIFTPDQQKMLNQEKRWMRNRNRRNDY